MEAILENASKQAIKWYPPHMRMGLNKVNSIFQNVSLVLEVRDARAPFETKNGVDLDGTLKNMKNNMNEPIRRCIIFNKTDLACPTYLERVRKMFSDPYNKRELGIESVFFVSSKRQEQVKPILNFIKECLVPKTGILLPKKNVLIVGIPNVGKSTLINKIRNYSLHTKNDAVVTGKLPGVTKHAGQLIKILEDPITIYLLDSPGILLPRISSTRTGLTLALLESVMDGIVDREILTNYLYTLLLRKKAHSVQMQEALKTLSDPLPIGSPLLDICINRCKLDNTFYGKDIPDLHGFRYKLLRMFRDGFFGPICLEPDSDDQSITDFTIERELLNSGSVDLVPRIEKLSNLDKFDRIERKKEKNHLLMKNKILRGDLR